MGSRDASMKSRMPITGSSVEWTKKRVSQIFDGVVMFCAAEWAGGVGAAGGGRRVGRAARRMATALWGNERCGRAERATSREGGGGGSLTCDSKKLAAVTRKEVEIIPKKMYL